MPAAGRHVTVLGMKGLAGQAAELPVHLWDRGQRKCGGGLLSRKPNTCMCHHHPPKQRRSACRPAYLAGRSQTSEAPRHCSVLGLKGLAGQAAELPVHLWQG